MARNNVDDIYKFLKILKYKIDLNRFKFQSKLLYRLGIYLKKFYKKRIEFNIVNLRSINFNIDILTSLLTMRITRRKKRISPMAGLLSYLVQKRVKFPRVEKNISAARAAAAAAAAEERISEEKFRNMDLIENNYENLNINSMCPSFQGGKVYYDYSLSGVAASSSLRGPLLPLSPLPSVMEEGREEGGKNIKYNSIDTKHEDIFNKSLLSFYKGISFENKDYSNIIDTIFTKIIKHKNMGGIKFQISGRLTKRYRADRAVFIRRIFGGLNNPDSSFKRISAVILRGYMNSNVEYAIFTAKRRIGAFAVKG